MIWLLVIIIPAIAIYLTYKNSPDRERTEITIICFIFSTLLTVFFCVAVSAYVGEEQIESFEREIVSLRQGEKSALHGSGNFLGWSINGESEAQYVIMEKFDNGAMKRRFLDQAETYIVETDEQPKVSYRQFKKVYSKIRHFPTLWNKLNTYYYFDDATIYVPKGTVIVNFDEL
jgi:hypothetical protein